MSTASARARPDGERFHPGVVATGGNLQQAAYRQHRKRKVGLVRSHELVDGPEPNRPRERTRPWRLPRSPVRYATTCSHGEGAAAPPAPGDSARRGAPPHRDRPGSPRCGPSARTVRIPWPATPGYNPPYQLHHLLSEFGRIRGWDFGMVGHPPCILVLVWKITSLRWSGVRQTDSSGVMEGR